VTGELAWGWTRRERLRAAPAHTGRVAYLHRERDHLFAFLTTPGVEATNWRAEHAVHLLRDTLNVMNRHTIVVTTPIRSAMPMTRHNSPGRSPTSCHLIGKQCWRPHIELSAT
jgi:hypothetical protein